MLLNEIVLDVLHFLDYSSLLRTKFASSNFLRLIVRNQELIASPRSICLSVGPRNVLIDQCPKGVSLPDSEPRNSGRFATQLAAAIADAALNPIALVKLWCKAVPTGAADKVLSSIPAGYYAPELWLCHGDDVRFTKAQLVAVIEHFRELKSIYLWWIPDDFDWTILRSSCFLRVASVDMAGKNCCEYFANEAAEAEITRFITDFSHLEALQSKFLHLHWTIPERLAMKIVQVCFIKLQSGMRWWSLEYLGLDVPNHDPFILEPVNELIRVVYSLPCGTSRQFLKISVKLASFGI